MAGDVGPSLVRAQFEKDIRSLVSFFCDRSTTSVKAKLMRLTQLSRMVSLESPAEVCTTPVPLPSLMSRVALPLIPACGQLLEYWGANEGPVPWEFNASEAKRVLCT